MPGAFLSAVLLAAVSASAPADAPGWVREDGADLALRVVLDHDRSCLGELVLDRNSRRVRFEGAHDEGGCRLQIDVGFEEVGAVRTRRCLAGFEVQLPSANPGRLVLVASPHAAWLQARCAARGGGPCATSAPPCSEADVPAGVQADSEKAVDLIRTALARVTGPIAALSQAVEGRARDAGVTELLDEPGAFAAQLLRVRGALEREGEAGEFRLSDEGGAIRLAPTPDLGRLLRSAAHWVGREVEVVGHLRRREPAREGPGSSEADYDLKALDCIGPEPPAADETPLVTLQSLATDPQAYVDRPVRVIGKFRGRNAHSDLPPRTQRGAGDWVVKSDQHAAWITGHGPAGPGFSLDVDAPGPNDWVEVVGRASRRGGVTYLEATRVSLVRPPAGARVRAPRQVVGTALPPVVVFSQPFDGEALAPEGQIVVQFGAHMDVESFERRVRLEALGPSEGDLVELPVRLRYVDERRTLIVSPAAPLEPGRRIRLRFLPGIVDVSGIPLAPRSGVPGAVEVLTYTVAPHEEGG